MWALHWVVDDLLVWTPSRPCQGSLYEVAGHASLAYDAVSIFCVASLATSVQWMPDKSKSTRSCWVSIAGAEIHSALHVPPPSSVARKERHSIVLSHFQKWDDAVVSEVNRTNQLMASDLNMTPDMKLLFEHCLQARGLWMLWWATQPTSGTHVMGGILDFFWCECDSAKAPPIVHDGLVCLSRGCRNPLCGNLADGTASTDLDHYVWTFATTLTTLRANIGAWSCSEVAVCGSPDHPGNCGCFMPRA